jgi:acyl-coenzyme A thioesterase PaaI-like protein
VGEAQTNPGGTLQGGILSSFFDDAFGMLCFASLHRPCVTIDLSVNFIRPVKLGSFVIIHAVFKGVAGSYYRFLRRPSTAMRSWSRPQRAI